MRSASGCAFEGFKWVVSICKLLALKRLGPNSCLGQLTDNWTRHDTKKQPVLIAATPVQPGFSVRVCTLFFFRSCIGQSHRIPKCQNASVMRLAYTGITV